MSRNLLSLKKEFPDLVAVTVKTNTYLSSFFSQPREVHAPYVRTLRPYTSLHYACRTKFITGKHKQQSQQVNRSQLTDMVITVKQQFTFLNSYFTCNTNCCSIKFN